MPETVELGAYRWLAQVQAGSRLRDVLFDQQRLQGDQQIEVQAFGIHWLDSSRAFLRFQIWLGGAESSWSRRRPRSVRSLSTPWSAPRGTEAVCALRPGEFAWPIPLNL